MGKVNVENLEEGMMISEDVKSGNQILLAKGVKLSTKHINIFKSWGISAVCVEGVSEQEITNQKLEQLTPKQRKSLEDNLKTKFKHVDLDFYPAQVLFNTCLLRKIE